MAQFVEKPNGKFARSGAAAAGILLSIMAGSFSSANAQYQGTQEMQQACTPDVMRLCNADVPDVERISACMKRNRANLSPACVAAIGVRVRHNPRRR